MDIEKQELLESARELGLEVKDATPKHILQRMIHKAQNTEDTGLVVKDVASVSIGEVIQKPRDIEKEVNIAFDEKAFKAQQDAEEALRAKIRAQLREEEIRKEELHAMQIERKKLKDLKKYEINYKLEDLKRSIESINQKYGNRAQIVWDDPLLGFHLVTAGYPTWHSLAQDMHIILRNVEDAIRPRNFAKLRQKDDGGMQLVSNGLSDIQVTL